MCQQSYERLTDNIISSVHTLSLIFSLSFPLFYFPLSFSLFIFLHTHSPFQFPLSFSHSSSSYAHTLPFSFYSPSALYILGTEYCKAGRSVKSGLTDLLDRVGLQSGLFGAVPPTPVSGPSGAYKNTATGTGVHILCHAMLCYAMLCYD